MNMKRRVKMRRGFMCQSPGSAAGCTAGDTLSVIVPRRPDRTLVDRANSLALNNSTSAKYARGFMCQSPGSAAGCTTGDPLSVIVPRRPDRTLVDRANSLALDDSTSAKYARLVESTPQRLGNNAAAKMKSTDSVPMPPVVKRRPGGDHKNTGVVGDRKALQKPAPAVASSADQVFQVVVMRVSLHCQGCAGKVKKHISKMEGVTSFSIDLESKRVTVMGHVSPVGVLESISKVKRAEFWPC